MSTSLSQHPPAELSVLHISDTHLLGGSKKLWGHLETESRLESLLERVRHSDMRPAALVFTGDLADTGQSGAYRTLNDIVDPVARDIGAQVIWVMGNHDERVAFAEQLWGEQATGEPLDRVYDIDGLRIIALDTSVPGFHHGDLTAGQVDWLREQLATPAPRGTLVAMHHPPIPTPLEIMGVIELEDQRSFWSVIEGSDVRGILAGHLHYSTFSAYRGIPVSVAAALCYNIDLVAPAGVMLGGIDAAHSSSLVSVYPDQVVFSELAASEVPAVFARPNNQLDEIRQWSPEKRRAVFSDKTSSFNRGEETEQSGS